MSPSMKYATCRFQRASSVQRQTDTLRRLAQQRDVAQRLQTLAPSLARPEQHLSDGRGGGGAMIITNPMAAGYATTAVHPDGGPVLLLSDDGGVAPHAAGEENNGDLTMGGAARGRRRPVPPPYACPADAIIVANVRAEEDGTYLV